MTTSITQRFSKITRLSGDLAPDDLMVVSQKEGTVQKTVNATTAEVFTYIENQIKTEGIGSIVYVDNGIIGTGSIADPVRLDEELLDQTLARKDHFQITRIGNRKTRYLPISRTSLYETSKYNSSLTRAPFTSTVEPTGELRIISPGTTAYTISIGDWSTTGNADSLQIIERKILPNNMPDGYTVKGVMSKSKNSAILIMGLITNPSVDEYWYASLTDGSLAEESYYDFTRITARSTSLGSIIANGSVACASTSASGRMFMVTVPPTDANTGIQIRTYVLSYGTSATVTEIASWSASSYCGILTGQNMLRVSDKFLGAATEKCELVDKTGGGIQVSLLNAGRSSARIQLINNPDIDNDLYLIVRRERNLTYQGNKTVYVSDIVLKINVTATSGVGSAIAVTKYQSNKPTVDAGWVYTNKRNTFRTPTLGVTDSEMMTILGDGSIMLVGDTVNGNEAGNIYLKKSIPGLAVTDILDLDLAASSNYHSDPMAIDVKPGYIGTSSPMYKVYIASPIKVYMNGTDYTIPAQILDLSGEFYLAPQVKFTDMPYGNGEFAGSLFRIVYIYVQQSGKIVQLIKSSTAIPESVTNSLLAVVYFGNSSIPRALYGQAYSRMGKYRPSYVPMGAAVPVSYNRATEKPVTYWIQPAVSVGSTPSFWADSSATNSPIQYASDGKFIYIRVALDGNMLGRGVTVRIDGYDLGAKTFIGAALVWGTSVSNKTTANRQWPAVVYETTNNEEIGRAYITVTPYPFITDIVNTANGDDVVTSVLRGSAGYIRVQGYDLAVGDTMSVSVTNPSGVVSNLGQQTYQGFPLYFPYLADTLGTHQVKTTNVTRNIIPPVITFTCIPAITNYTPGTYTISIPAGRTAEITLLGGGGGGGGSIHNYSSSQYWVSNLGNDGGDSTLIPNSGQSISTTALIAGGGKGGIGANWGNSSSFNNGSAGAGGLVTNNNSIFTTIKSINGVTPAIGPRTERQPGGATVAVDLPATNNGAGGQGAIGVGDDQWSYGGGGGSGAELVVRYTNNSPNVVTMTLKVGDAGAGWKKTTVTNGNNGDDGIPGYGIVEII